MSRFSVYIIIIGIGIRDHVIWYTAYIQYMHIYSIPMYMYVYNLHIYTALIHIQHTYIYSIHIHMISKAYSHFVD